MGTKLAVSWQDHGSFIRVFADIPSRRNGLPNTGAMQAALHALDSVNPEAYDPPEPVPETVARAFQHRIEHVEMSAESPPVPDFDLGVPTLDAGLLPDDDEIIFPRACRVGGCGEE